MFLTWLGELSQLAADVLNDCLEILERHAADTPHTARRGYHLVHDIADVTGDVDRTQVLLMILVHQGGIRLRRGHDPNRPHVKQLVDRGVLERAGPRLQRFVPTQDYLPALAEIRPRWVNSDGNPPGPASLAWVLSSTE